LPFGIALVLPASADVTGPCLEFAARDEATGSVGPHFQDYAPQCPKNYKFLFLEIHRPPQLSRKHDAKTRIKRVLEQQPPAKAAIA
jgi:hypothetical protein